MTRRPAFAAAARALDPVLPAEVLAHVEWTAQVDALSEDSFGLALRREDEGLLMVLMAGSPRMARALSDMVRAFLGPSYAMKRRPGAHLHAGDDFAQAVLSLSPLESVQVLVSPHTCARAAANALSRLLAVHGRRPHTAATVARPLAVILRDFEGAVRRTDISTAITLRDEAWSTGRLALVNRSYLDARIIAVSGDAETLLDHVRRFRLADMRLPGPVEHDVIRAVAQVFLIAAAAEGRDQALEAFRERVAPEFGAVFRDHRVAASGAARLAWVLHYLTA